MEMEKAIDGMVYICNINAEAALYYVQDAKNCLAADGQKPTAAALLKAALGLYNTELNSKLLGHNA
jgi:hypothetical protein